LARVPTLEMGWKLVEGDARALPFADHSFDVVTATYLLHVLDEAAREAPSARQDGFCVPTAVWLRSRPPGRERRWPSARSSQRALAA